VSRIILSRVGLTLRYSSFFPGSGESSPEEPRYILPNPAERRDQEERDPGGEENAVAERDRHRNHKPGLPGGLDDLIV